MKTSTLKRNSTLKSHIFLKSKHSSFSKKSTLKSTKMSQNGPVTQQETLDQIFSEYVRRLHANSMGWVQCVTCGITRRWNDRMDAGHFIPRQHLATRYDIYNVFCQCIDCNRYNDGRIEEFTQYLCAAFGELHVQELKEKSQQIIIHFPYKEKIAEFSEKLQILVEQSSGIEY